MPVPPPVMTAIFPAKSFMSDHRPFFLRFVFVSSFVKGTAQGAGEARSRSSANVGPRVRFVEQQGWFQTSLHQT